jgi:hypothetical protein
VTGRDGDALARPVAAPGGGPATKPFGDFTTTEVRARAEELRSTVGFGPTARVASVARGWSELARAMDADGARTVADLGPERGAEFARRLWVVPPGGTLLS